MLGQQGMSEQTRRIKTRLPAATQYLLFSATFPDRVAEFARTVVPAPLNQIRLKREEVAIGQIKNFVVDCGSEANKFTILEDIYGYLSVGQSIIFVQRRDTADDLYRKMTAAGHAVSEMRGGKDIAVEERDRVIDLFRSGGTKVLIATNLLARGIDIPQVSLVINYDLPVNEHAQPDPHTYLHRVGRSGRFGRNGLAINLVHDERSKATLRAISNEIQKEMIDLPPEKIEDLDKLLKELNAPPPTATGPSK
eukprot:TRINITY_DN1983_c0_g1_i3.p1 TRINITY_DN1983_c0_g1~~TRINITY_DN1983_c0_g1_i3.p1  ORF type:complete len:251 (-),score=61.41 TRINITY_DN1983_c0_g1_i3:40-792(-)